MLAVRSLGRVHPASAQDASASRLLPLLDVILEQPVGEKFVMLALRNTTNASVRKNRSSPLSCSRPAVAQVLRRGSNSRSRASADFPRCMRRMDDVLAKQKKQLAIPHRHVR